MSAHAASDPGSVAVDFLEKVRIGKLDLKPGGDTAISPQTADAKKQEIAKRLERMARDLGTDPLEIGAVRTDENFAAVLIRKIGGFDPNRLQVFPVALVKRGESWSVAPVPASFENAGTGYAISLRKRLEILENWMLREQVIDLEKLREQAAARMRKKIEASLPAAELQKLTAEQAAQRFLTACEAKDLPAVLGLLGGLATKLPDDWATRLKSADQAFSSTRPTFGWRLMTAPEVTRVIVNHEAESDQGLCSIACLDPASDSKFPLPRIKLIHLSLSRNDEGFWRIDPSEAFFNDEEVAQDSEDSDLDSDLIDSFSIKWLDAHPTTPAPTARAAHDGIIAALRSSSLTPTLQLASFGADPAAARKTCALAAQLWWSLRNPVVAHHLLPLAFQEKDDTAAALFQIFTASEPDRFTPKWLYYEKSESGWLWTPDPSKATRENFSVFAESELKRGSTDWQALLLAESYQLKDLSAFPSPGTEEVSRIIKSWNLATYSSHLDQALALTAYLSDPKGGAAVLRNMGHEVVAARRNKATSTISGIYQGKIISAVGMKIDQAGKTIYPFYPVIQTPQGPRILVEIDLFASRGREFLNNMAFERLQTLGSQPAADDLRVLFQKFSTDIENNLIDKK